MYLEVPPSELKPKYDRFPLPYDVQLLYVNSHSSLTAAKIITSFTLMIFAFNSNFNSLPESHALKHTAIWNPITCNSTNWHPTDQRYNNWKDTERSCSDFWAI